MATYRLYPTGFASEAWRVERHGEHVCNVRLTIDATGRGTYQITRWDRSDLRQWAQLVREGTFAFDVWDRATVVDLLGKIIREGIPGAEVDVEIKRPSR